MTRLNARRWLAPIILASCQGALAQTSPDNSHHSFIPHNEQGQTAPAATGVQAVGGGRLEQPACYANCDQSTTAPVLNVNDFACFLNHFAAGDTYANCDQSTIPPVLNVLDFSCFLNAFAAGCTA